MNANTASEKPWYQAAFDDLYEILYRHRDDVSAAREVEQLVRLLHLESGQGRILDACCGNGRHAAAFARCGFAIMGTDLSLPQLHRASNREELAGRIARCDIRALPFHRSFDLVLNLFTSFGYFVAEEENVRALRQLVRILRPGGRLVMDHMNRSLVEYTLVKQDERVQDGYRIVQQRRIDGNRIVKSIEVTGQQGERFEIEENVRMFHPEEITRLFHDAGLQDVQVYGSFSGSTFTSNAKRMILVGRKGEES